MKSIPSNVFAYGTLKVGQCRERFWARRPQQIVRAWIEGTLYDTGPYPALDLGHDRIAGELWMFAEDEMDEILQVLDAEEGFQGLGAPHNLYERRTVECTTQDGRMLTAHVYYYARTSEFVRFQRLQASIEWNQCRFVIWPVGADW